MKIYGVYDVYGGANYGETVEIDRYYSDREKALEFIANEGGPEADLTDWLVEIEVIE
tara:strand:+ start:262 stop:432 length:171 start_codon:yes stop_codon:yes gene_type:complete